MMRNWQYSVTFLSFILLSFHACAVSDEDMAEFLGKDILYSSPFERGDKAVVLHSDEIRLSDNFIDDGFIVVNQKDYPIDQLFVKNSNGRYENLAFVLNYDGVANTYFIRYYDKERLALKDEVERLKHEAENCIGTYAGGGLESVAEETEQYGQCLDNVFYRSIDLFYSRSYEHMVADYEKISELWKKLYFDMANPDNCYGKCGTVAQMQAYGRVIDAKKNFILDLLNTPQLKEDAENH